MKQKMVEKLKTLPKKVCSKRFGSRFGKPFFPQINDQIVRMQDLSHFIREDSWSIFSLAGIDTGFFEVPAESWMENETFCNNKEIISSLSVVNDDAERGVKLSHDYICTAKKEDNLQSILQVVQNERNIIPNQRKRQTQSKCWYLKL